MTTTTKLAPGRYDVDLDRLTPAADNPRKDLGDLTSLAESIRAHGVLQPVTVTTDGLLVFGHRRYAASKLAGKTTIPAEVREMTERERVEAMVAENLERVDLNPIEEAQAFELLLPLFGDDEEQVAKRLHRSRTLVHDRLVLRRLPDVAQRLLAEGRVRIGEAMLLATIADERDEAERIAALWAKAVAAGRTHLPDEGFYGVDHAVSQARHKVAQRERLAKIRASLVGHPNVIERAFSEGMPAGTHARVDPRPYYGEVRMEPGDHRSLPCSLVVLWTDSADAQEFCTAPEAHAKPERGDQAQPERATVERPMTLGRRLEETRNQRYEWAQRMRPKSELIAPVLLCLCDREYAYNLADALGTTDIAGIARIDPRLVVVAWAADGVEQLLADLTDGYRDLTEDEAIEDARAVLSWLTTMAETGYVFSDAEREAFELLEQTIAGETA